MDDELQRRGLLALAGFAALGGSTATRADDAPKHVPLERVPPDAPLGQMVDGKLVSLADFGGKPVVVVFWASWCPVCRKELPDMERLQLATGDRVRVVAVNGEDRQVFRKLARLLSDSKMLHVYDPKGESGKAFGAPNSVPYTLVVGADGAVFGTQSGWGDNSLSHLVRRVDAAIAAVKPLEG